MEGFRHKIRRAWQQFKSADLGLGEFFLLLANKLIGVWEKFFVACKSFLNGRDANVIYGFNAYLPPSIVKPKRALVSYSTGVFYRRHFLGNLKYYFTNYGTVLELVKALNELGYAVDIINQDYKNLRAGKPYDLIVYHNFFNFKFIRSLVSPETVLIFFDTVAYWRQALLRLEIRYEDFNRRRALNFYGNDINNYKKLLARQDEIDGIIKAADGVIVIGDQLAKTYDGFANVHKIINGCYPDNKYKKDLGIQNLEKGRRNFFFFGSSLDNIRKGLDLLFEAFIGTEFNLYVCSEIDERLLNSYKVREHSNIHLLGYVKQGTKKFYNIINACDFIIYPSCVEGMPGGALDAMRYGLIPILSKECNIEVEDFGMLLGDLTVAEIRRAVSLAAGQSPEWLAKSSRLAAAEVKARYAPEVYVKLLKEAVLAIIKS